MTIKLKYPDDPYRELYPRSTDAYEAGKKVGRLEALTEARNALSRISGNHEPKDDPTGFHVAEECCAAIMALLAPPSSQPVEVPHEGKGEDTP